MAQGKIDIYIYGCDGGTVPCGFQDQESAIEVLSSPNTREMPGDRLRKRLEKHNDGIHRISIMDYGPK